MRLGRKAGTSIRPKDEFIDQAWCEGVQPGSREELRPGSVVETGANRHISARRGAVYELVRKRLAQIIQDVGSIDRVVLPETYLSASRSLLGVHEGSASQC